MDLFSSISQQDLLVFLIFIVSAFLVGYLLSWLVGARQAAKWKPEAQKANAELKSLQAEYQSFKDQFATREAELQRAQVEAEETKRQLRPLQEERKRLTAELEETQAELIRLESAVTAQQVTIEDLNDQILGMRTKTQATATAADVPDFPYEPVDAVAEMQSAFNAALQRLAAVEEKLRLIESASRAEAAVEKLFETAEEEEDDDDEARIEAARAIVRAAIAPAPEGQKDDLQQIKGIGPFIEKQLNELGIATYSQIAQLDENLIGHLTTAIQFFPGRIQKDQWVEQAKELVQ
jgi:predicted flap endonuclease-1-like 5' DNA nuclease/archaellum component FlaC